MDPQQKKDDNHLQREFKGFAMNVQVKHDKNRWDYRHPKLSPFQGDVQKSFQKGTWQTLQNDCPSFNLFKTSLLSLSFITSSKHPTL